MRNTAFKVLLLEDEDVDELIVRKLLEKATFNSYLLHHKNCRDALRCLKSLNTDTFPDLVMVDILLTGASGFVFLEEYGKLYSQLHPDTLVIVLSSSLNRAYKDKALSYPFVTHYWVKPLTRARVKQLKPAWIKQE